MLHYSRSVCEVNIMQATFLCNVNKHFRHHRSNAAYCYRRSSVIGRSVCLLVTFVSSAKTAEPVEMPIGG